MGKNGGNKSRYFCGICYPENMVDDWEESIGDRVEYPYAYCIHNKDHLGAYKAKRTKDAERQRKTHVHIILAFNNTTTETVALELLNRLSKPGEKCCSTVEAVRHIRNKYEYLLHNTETARKQKKYLYDPSERKTGNNFDIGSYEQISLADKTKMKMELADLIIVERFANFYDFYATVRSNFSDEYFDIVCTYSSFFERLTRGVYQKMEQNHQ